MHTKLDIYVFISQFGAQFENFGKPINLKVFVSVGGKLVVSERHVYMWTAV